GVGRDEPNQHPFLEEPKRPQTSFLWFTSPLKTLRYIVWRNYKWYFIIAILLRILILFLILFFYSFPGAVVNKLMGS
ncbi:hypothetical protein GH877_30420, partial [Bacillus thuringiensis]|nr:hypothetical protein [Bacillus thuringiensis]